MPRVAKSKQLTKVVRECTVVNEPADAKSTKTPGRKVQTVRYTTPNGTTRFASVFGNPDQDHFRPVGSVEMYTISKEKYKGDVRLYAIPSIDNSVDEDDDDV